MSRELSREKTLKESLGKFNLSVPQQVALLLCNYIPFLHLVLIAGTLYFPWATIGWRLAAAIAVLYMLPPLVARSVLLILPIRDEHIAIPSRDYFVWWLTLNLQTIFCRLSFLEELMRMIPGAYNMWLRLWGARIGGFTYWAAGLRILDRSFLDIGKGVVFGAGVRLNPHVIAENADGEMELILARIHLGARAIVGGYALLTAGTRIADDEATRACLLSPPFSHWQGGKRIRKSKSAEDL
jgi:hypothetical protein